MCSIVLVLSPCLVICFPVASLAPSVSYVQPIHVSVWVSGFLFYCDRSVSCASVFWFASSLSRHVSLGSAVSPFCCTFPHYPLCIYYVCFLCSLSGCLCFFCCSSPCVSRFQSSWLAFPVLGFFSFPFCFLFCSVWYWQKLNLTQEPEEKPISNLFDVWNYTKAETQSR